MLFHERLLHEKIDCVTVCEMGGIVYELFLIRKQTAPDVFLFFFSAWIISQRMRMKP